MQSGHQAERERLKFSLNVQISVRFEGKNDPDEGAISPGLFDVKGSPVLPHGPS